ncbi:flavodoxin family protein [Paraclostridium sordellii]|uniref:flavodoxin family protein n=1 Tax=Paraclostridium sordellii TaxID=1505 RepID=UPI00054452A9|nr:flavodoxin family protein [Paeniclostridium sordellii]MCQ4696264.1 flavodoxin family protein [Paeniclostridium sordellii]MDU1453412.1 flavodoxin family protein [Paeniclostridium sordellii]MDU2146570.1 flavodoxin family protein [Paeniclostridium sordellii]MDU2686444.1 flavodoxin family protein [Paeniclostridium sordellii]MDU6114969.1 flavodoxin family protein [Paeniclostridium sordellii]
MKVVAFNGSPHKKGNTYNAIETVAKELEKEGIEVEIVHVGNKAIRGCIACGGCSRNQNERCVLDKDEVNEWIQKMKEADGIILGSPVYYSAIAGTMKSFLDRAFYVASSNGGMFRHKVGASVVAVRRSGGIPVFDQLNNYINYSEMIMPTSNYWNVAYGTAPGEVTQDEEGMQIMRVLGKNMAWMMKVVEAGKSQVKENEKEDKIFTNFIR